MLNFHNPYADGEEPETDPEPQAEPDTDVIRQIRRNIAKIRENQSAVFPEKAAYSQPDPAQLDGLMAAHERFLKALVRIHLTIAANDQQPAGAEGFRFVGGAAEKIRIVAADGAETDIGGIRVKDFPFAKWLLENYGADMETLQNGIGADHTLPQTV